MEARSRSTPCSATARRSAAAPASCRASTGIAGNGDRRGARRPRRSRSSRRSASRSSWRGLQRRLAAGDARRGRRATALGWGERALELATSLGDEHARARAHEHRQRARPDRRPRRRRRCSRRTRWPTRSGSARRRPARSSTRLRPDVWARPEQALRYAEQGARLRARSTRCTPHVPTSRPSWPG